MEWNLDEAIAYYKRQGAPADQTALRNLLREIQQERGGISEPDLEQLVTAYNTPRGLFLALIRRTSGLRLLQNHTLELCAGPNCGKSRALAEAAQRLCDAAPEKVTLRFVPCMRLCGKGPNLKLNGKLYHRADEALLAKLLKEL